MSTFNIKVTEYGIKRNNKVQPEHYTWDYCVKKRIPYITVKPKIKYSAIDYDLITIDDGISFENESILADFWSKYYDNYIINARLPKDKIKGTIGARVGWFNVRREDEVEIVSLIMSKIEEYVNLYGIINPETKAYYEQSKESQQIARERGEYLESQGL